MLVLVKDESDERIWINDEYIVAIVDSDGEYVIEVNTGTHYYINSLPLSLIEEEPLVD